MPPNEGTYPSPPRTHGTPSGFRNVRVLVPQDLHFRLQAYASQSHLSLPAFVVAWLNLAAPLEPLTNSRGQQRAKEPAPGHRPANDHQQAPGLAGGPVSAHSPQEPAPGQGPASGPLDVPGNAVGQCAAPRQEATATSAVPLNPDAASSGSSPTNDTARSTLVMDNDEAEPERTSTR